MGYTTIKKSKAKTAEQATAALEREGARRELASGDAYKLMARWEVAKEDRERIVQGLIQTRFIDDRRYAKAYIRDKINLSNWGERKITTELSKHGISREIIAQEMAEVDTEVVNQRLREVLEKRSRSVKHKNNYELKGKLIRYGVSLGYSFEVVNNTISQLNLENKEEEIWDDF
ncbi:MAG: regulatory protein RecX [Rikenellaceae bacterium]